VVRIYNASDLSLIPSSPYLIAVSIVLVLLGGVFADAGEDNHAIKLPLHWCDLPALAVGVVARTFASGIQVSSLKDPRWFRRSHFRNPLHARLNFNTHRSRDMMVTE
jgi:hypothetical protein